MIAADSLSPPILFKIIFLFWVFELAGQFLQKGSMDFDMDLIESVDQIEEYCNNNNNKISKLWT